MSAIDGEQLARRVLLQAVLDGSALHWRRRAERVEAELSRPPSRPHWAVHRLTEEEQAERRRRLEERASAFRSAAAFWGEHMRPDDLVPEAVALVDGVLAEDVASRREVA